MLKHYNNYNIDTNNSINTDSTYKKNIYPESSRKVEIRSGHKVRHFSGGTELMYLNI